MEQHQGNQTIMKLKSLLKVPLLGQIDLEEYKEKRKQPCITIKFKYIFELSLSFLEKRLATTNAYQTF